MVFLMHGSRPEPAPSHSERSRIASARLLALLDAWSAEAASYAHTMLGTLRSDIAGVSEATGLNDASDVDGNSLLARNETGVVPFSRTGPSEDLNMLISRPSRIPGINRPPLAGARGSSMRELPAP
jgi:hypothetical protein